MKRLYTLLMTILLTGSALAQAPQKMSYQAVVRDAQDSLLTNQKISIQISLMQGWVTGKEVYVETQIITTNDNGLFSIEIGTGTVVSGSLTDIDWSDGPYFIKIETDPTGGTTYTITGTSQLLSVPYALHANTADSFSGGVVMEETDPVFSSSIAAGITATDTAYWSNQQNIILPVDRGGTGSTGLTGYVKANGTLVMSAGSTIPSTDVTGLITKVNGSLPDVTGNVTVLMGNVTTGTLAARPGIVGTNGDIYLVSGDGDPNNDGRTFISDAISWNEVTTNQAATDARYLQLAGGTLSGDVVVPTTKKITLTDAPISTTDAANKGYVDTQVGAVVADQIVDATTIIAPSQNAVFDALALKAPIASPTFTGTPAAPTPTIGTNTTQVATTAFVAAAVLQPGTATGQMNYWNSTTSTWVKLDPPTEDASLRFKSGLLVWVENTAPTASITYSASSPYKNGDAAVTITATFNESILDSPIPTIAIVGVGISSVSATNMTKTSTTVYTYTYTVPTGDGTATVTLGTGTDAAGNVVTSTPTSGATFTVDNTAPTASITYSASSPHKNGDAAVTITATFNESILDSPIPTIAIVGVGISSVSATNMTKTSTTVYTYTYTVPTGDGTATVTLGTGTDAAGNVVTSTPTSGATFTVDNTAPSITSTAKGKNFLKDSFSGLEAGQTVYTITASDAVGVDSYAISGVDAPLLSVNASTGVVTLNASPNASTARSYSFTVTATDAAGNTSAATTVKFAIIIIVLGVPIMDVDEIAPVITSATTGTNLVENAGAGQIVYTITASDVVGVDSYAISGVDASLLSVNASTGVVTLTANPDYETKSSYTFTVTATDAAGNTSAATTVTFSITDVLEIGQPYQPKRRAVYDQNN